MITLPAEVELWPVKSNTMDKIALHLNARSAGIVLPVVVLRRVHVHVHVPLSAIPFMSSNFIRQYLLIQQ